MEDLCGVAGCERTLYSRGMCSGHYQRAARGKPLDGPIRPRPRGATCDVEGCGKPREAWGYCIRHVYHYKRHGDPLHEPAPRGNFSPDRTASAAARRTPDHAVQYWTMHGRLRRLRGPAGDFACRCGEPAHEWAYDHRDAAAVWGPTGRASKVTAPYSLDLAHYMPLCVTCHRRFDAAHVARPEWMSDWA